MEQQQTTTRGEEEIAAGEEGGLLLSSPHLQRLMIWHCLELSLLASSLQGLRSLNIRWCPKFLSSCVWPLLAHGCLTDLAIYHTHKFYACLEPPRTHDKEPTSCKLQYVNTDDITGFLAMPIRSLLFSSITRLSFNHNHEVGSFTKKQEDALQLLTSLEYLGFLLCHKLQCLPAGLHRLSSLKTLCIQNCQAFKSLPKDGLPTSLQFLLISACPSLKLLSKDGLPSSLEKLTIHYCPALKSLPSHGLPNSLRVLDVQRGGNSEELMRQCRELKGTIPIIKD